MAAACITAHHEQRGLRTEDRHEANGVSNERAARKRACLCGMRSSELLLTCNHRLLTGNAQRRNSSDALSLRSGEMQQLFRSDALLQMQCLDRTADLL
jgi:hypothetical protein